MAEVRNRWGDEETVTEMVGSSGENARPQGSKLTLFSWLPQSHPRCDPRRRWRDVIRIDLKDIGVSEEKWYDEAVRLRAGWRALCCDGLKNCRQSEVVRAPAADRDVVCEVCSRSFR